MNIVVKQAVRQRIEILTDEIDQRVSERDLLLKAIEPEQPTPEVIEAEAMRLTLADDQPEPKKKKRRYKFSAAARARMRAAALARHEKLRAIEAKRKGKRSAA